MPYSRPTQQPQKAHNVDMEKIHLRLPKGLKKKAEAYAVARGSNLSQLIRQSLIEKIKYILPKLETDGIKLDKNGNIIWTEETWAAHCAETGAITQIEIEGPIERINH